MAFRTRIALVIVLVGFMAARAPAQGPLAAELEARIDALAAAALEAPGAVGLSVAVGVGDRVVYAKGFGLAEVEHKVPADAETLFRIGSVTKQYTAAAVMRLVEQGKLSLDDPIEKVLPEYPAPAKPVTIRRLLDHTSGIPSYTGNHAFMMRDASLELTPQEMLATFKDAPLDFEPGTEFKYNNSAYYLLGLVIEKASGKPYPQYLADEFFTPLGLKRTRYESNREVIPNRAQGYDFQNGKLLNDRPIGADVPGAAGSLLATAADLVRWQIALTGGEVVTPSSYEQMSTGLVLPDGTPTNYGFGLAIGTLEGRRAVQHGGGIFGFNSMLAYYPEQKVSVAVISNSDAVSSGRLARVIAAAALGLESASAKDLAIDPETIARFAGHYAFETIPLEIRIFGHEGRLFSQATQQPEIRLLYQGGAEFRADFDRSVRIVFPETTDGPAASLTLHQGGQSFIAKRKP